MKFRQPTASRPRPVRAAPAPLVLLAGPVAAAAFLVWLTGGAAPASAQTDSQVQIEPASGPPGTRVRVTNRTGEGCPPVISSGVVSGSAVSPGRPRISFSDMLDSGFLGGDWRTQFNIPPDAPPGTAFTVTATCQHIFSAFYQGSRSYAPASFTVTASAGPRPVVPAVGGAPATNLRFTRNPAEGPPGARITVSSVDPCPAGSTVALVDLQQRTGDRVTAGGVRLALDPSGQWNGTIGVGAAAPAGVATLVPTCLEERSDGAFVRGLYSTAPFQVTAPPGPRPVVPSVAQPSNLRFQRSPASGPPRTTISVSSLDPCPAGSNVVVVDFLPAGGGPQLTVGGKPLRWPLNPAGGWSFTFPVRDGAPPGPVTLHARCGNERPGGGDATITAFYASLPFQVAGQPSSASSAPRPGDRSAQPGAAVGPGAGGGASDAAPSPFLGTPPTASSAPPGRSDLPRTGSGLMPLVAVASWLLSAGAAIVVWARGGGRHGSRADW